MCRSVRGKFRQTVEDYFYIVICKTTNFFFTSCLSALPHCLLAIRFHKFQVTLFIHPKNLVLCICLPVLIPWYLTAFELCIIDTCQKVQHWLAQVFLNATMCVLIVCCGDVICCFKSPLVIKEGTSIASKQTFCLHCSPFFKEQLRLSVYFASFCQSDGQFAFPFGDNFWDPSCLYSFRFKFWKRGTCFRNLQTTDGRRNWNRRGVKRSEKRHRSLL